MDMILRFYSRQFSVEFRQKSDLPSDPLRKLCRNRSATEKHSCSVAQLLKRLEMLIFTQSIWIKETTPRPHRKNGYPPVN